METYVVTGYAEGEITEKKSRFIGQIYEIHSEEDALKIIESIRKKYWDARHNCYAYVLGRNNEIQRFSDDREPSGTAGKPILEVLLGNEIRNALIVVTRYFGGVLLGTGGLVRAYTNSSIAAIDSLKRNDAGRPGSGKLMQVLDGMKISFALDYKDINRFDSLCMRLEMCTVDKEYREQAVYTMIIEDSRLDGFIKDAGSITRGSFSLISKEPVTFAKSGSMAVIYNL